MQSRFADAGPADELAVPNVTSWPVAEPVPADAPG